MTERAVDYDAFTASGPAEDETAVLPDRAPTQLGWQAWSELTEEEIPRRPWRHAWVYAGLILTGLAAAAIAITLRIPATPMHADGRTIGPPLGAQTFAPPAPAPRAAVPDDQAFLQALRANPDIVIDHPDKAIATAHWVCDQLGRGWTRDRIQRDIQESNPGLNPSGVAGSVNISTQYYCPQYS